MRTTIKTSLKTMSSLTTMKEEARLLALWVAVVTNRKKMGLSFWTIWNLNLGH